jgi:hypothetical protein
LLLAIQTAYAGIKVVKSALSPLGKAVIRSLTHLRRQRRIAEFLGISCAIGPLSLGEFNDKRRETMDPKKWI